MYTLAITQKASWIGTLFSHLKTIKSVFMMPGRPLQWSNNYLSGSETAKIKGAPVPSSSGPPTHGWKWNVPMPRHSPALDILNQLVSFPGGGEWLESMPKREAKDEKYSSLKSSTRISLTSKLDCWGINCEECTHRGNEAHQNVRACRISKPSRLRDERDNAPNPRGVCLCDPVIICGRQKPGGRKWRYLSERSESAWMLSGIGINPWAVSLQCKLFVAVMAPKSGWQTEKVIWTPMNQPRDSSKQQTETLFAELNE